MTRLQRCLPTPARSASHSDAGGSLREVLRAGSTAGRRAESYPHPFRVFPSIGRQACVSWLLIFRLNYPSRPPGESGSMTSEERSVVILFFIAVSDVSGTNRQTIIYPNAPYRKLKIAPLTRL